MSKALKTLILVAVVTALACLHWGNWGMPGGDGLSFRDALIAFAALSFFAEASYFRLRVGKAATHSSIVFIPFIAAILLFESGWSMLLACFVVALAEQFLRHKPLERVVYNVSQHGISVWSGSTVFRLLGGVPALSVDAIVGPGSLVFPSQVTAIGAGILTYFLVNITAVSLAVSLSEGMKVSEAWTRIASSQFLYDLVSSPLGVLLAFFYVKLGLLGVVATLVPLFFVRHAYRATIQLEEANRELLELMVKAIEARDPYTSGHSQRVSEYAGLIARQVGLGAKTTEHVRTAALLHDVGKIYEEYAPLLRKEGRLEPTEKALMQTHSTRSAELANTISAFRGVIVDAIRHHHENYDGSGYPVGLRGEAIPLGSRIIMLADTIDAMTTDRPYRKALSFDRMAQELVRNSGKQFDPVLVTAALKCSQLRAALMGREEADSGLHTPRSLLVPASWRSRVLGAG